jgi:Holliday junction resolvase RusA-like endonuclease
MRLYTLPYPPSVNKYYRHVGPRVLISEPGRRYRRLVEREMLAQRAMPLTGLLAVEVDLYPPDRRRRDIDNTQKGLLDALQHAGLYEDDSQIVDLHLRRMEPCEGGRAVVRIGPARERLSDVPAAWVGKANGEPVG